MLSIRAAKPKDAALLATLIRELAEYDRLGNEAMVVEEDVLRDGFGPNPKFQCVIAEWGGQPAGFAFYFYNYSTWQGRPGLYLEDLFVRPQYREKGIGKALLIHLAQVAVRENCGRFQWQVLDWNTPAIQFYESLGARKLTEWLTMRLEGEELKRLSTCARKAECTDGT